MGGQCYQILYESILLKTVYIKNYGVDGVTFEFAKFITKKFSPEFIENIIKENPNRLIIAYQSGNPTGAEIIYNSNCTIRKVAVPELSKLYFFRTILRTRNRV